jgi:hypothetical protein
MADAIASREGQSSMIDRKEPNSDMGANLGQMVLDCKANLSCDCPEPLGHNVPMAKKLLSDYELRFLARTNAARESTGKKQGDFASQLQDGMEQDYYKQYETRSMLPYELIPKFLSLTGVNYEWLFEGKGDGPDWKPRHKILVEREEAKRIRGRKQKRAA